MKIVFPLLNTKVVEKYHKNQWVCAVYIITMETVTQTTKLQINVTIYDSRIKLLHSKYQK